MTLHKLHKLLVIFLIFFKNVKNVFPIDLFLSSATIHSKILYMYMWYQKIHINFETMKSPKIRMEQYLPLAYHGKYTGSR